jgi:hypothetical protein
MAETIKEQVNRRKGRMAAIRSPYEPDWREINRYTSATVNESLNGGKASKRRANTSAVTSRGIKAARIATSGMTTGLSNPAATWFVLASPYPDLDSYQPVREWLEVVQNLIYDFLSGTNFYDSCKLTYAELLRYGTGLTTMHESYHYGMVFTTFQAGEYFIDNDEGHVADTMVRCGQMSVGTLVERFVRPANDWNVVSRKVKELYDKGNYEAMVAVTHMVEPNRERDESKSDRFNKQYRSIYIEDKCDDKDRLLRRSGFEEKSFFAPRWVEEGGSPVYGAGPAYTALPDLRELQLSSRRRGRNLDTASRPPLGAPVGMAHSNLTLDAATIAYGSTADLSAIRPLYQPDPRLIQYSREEVQDHEQSVMECFFADLFMAITEMQGIQPRNADELALRHEEKLSQLGPVVERVNNEMLKVAVSRAFATLQRFGQLPPAPPELQNLPLRIEFTSLLALAQKASTVGSIQRSAQFVGFVAGMYSDAADLFDHDRAIRLFNEANGVPPSIMRSDDEVAEIRARRAQQQQQQMAMEQAAQGAQAAQILSSTQVNEDNMLGRIMGGG